MWDLEYLLLFGLPGNKWELWDGFMHCRFPFSQRADAEAHWELWLDTLKTKNHEEPDTLDLRPTRIAGVLSGKAASGRVVSRAAQA